MKIGMSDFARARHKPGSGYSYYKGSEEDLISLIEWRWDRRFKGNGDTHLDKVCIVPLPPDNFVGNTIHIDKVEELTCEIKRRREGEDPFVSVSGKGEITKPKYVRAVLYSRDELGEQEASGEYDWEIVAILASDVPDEPMHPLTMARNQLDKTGGTYREYTSHEWARAVWYWSQHIMMG